MITSINLAAGGMGGIMARLRRETAGLHAATEDLPLMRDLMSTDVRPAHYRAYLGAIALPYRVIEPRLRELCSPATWARLGVTPKLPALEQDLAALSLHPPELSATLRARLNAHLIGESEAIGGLYVLEGATLGGRVISAQVRRHLGAQAQGLSFHFLGTREDGSPSADWRRFGAALEAEITAGRHAPEPILAGAHAVFEFVHWALLEGKVADAR